MDLALNVMRNTPHTMLRKFAFELHFGREPNTEWCNMLKLDKTKSITNDFISARPDTLQVYSLSSDHLPMKQREKEQKRLQVEKGNIRFNSSNEKKNKKESSKAHSQKIYKRRSLEQNIP